MEEIILLVDYKSSFGSKYNSIPPYSGLDLKSFSNEMNKFGYNVVPTHFFDLKFNNPNIYKSKKILYQSSEANDNYSEYKSYIDDVLYFLKLAGAELIPEYSHFKSHSNKVFMELLRGFMKDKNNPKSKVYGTLEDFKICKNENHFPLVIKKSHGAQSTGVFKAENKKELDKIIKNISKSSFTIKEVLKETVRSLKYKNYKPFSINRNKFIVQSFTKGLKGDFKILIFHDIMFCVKRDNPPNDFRASGGGYNSFTGEFNIPDGLLSYAHEVYKNFKCPYISLDIGINEEGFQLIEYQFINFGTSGHSKSEFYIKKTNDTFNIIDNNLTLEYLYSYSLNYFFKK